MTATLRASWRVFVSGYVLDETERVMTEELGFSRRLATLTRRRIMRIAARVEPGSSRHVVPQDARDNPILRAALQAGCDFLVTNDAHLLALNPYEGLRVISMTDYFRLLGDQGLI
jgi:predicted nucleic acid-binding protein